MARFFENFQKDIILAVFEDRSSNAQRRFRYQLILYL